MSKGLPIRILIAEDHLIARVGMSAIVNAQPDMSVVAEAVNGDQARSFYRAHLPDVTLMDMRMPVMNGFQALAAIRGEFPEARIVALSTFGGDEDIRRALVLGARAYLTKDVLHDEMIGAIRTVHMGRRYLPAPVSAILASDLSHASLSVREVEVLELIVKGLSNKQIAYQLAIAEDTAKNHVKSILKKLGAGDRTQAATKAIQRGIVHLPQ
ncbi:MAG TPA: response regulator transcription factor [Bryobacteraceae bacterium]|nr:response regulator transcription factor [Bryobacteraceae bacterium]